MPTTTSFLCKVKDSSTLIVLPTENVVRVIGGKVAHVIDRDNRDLTLCRLGNFITFGTPRFRRLRNEHAAFKLCKRCQLKLYLKSVEFGIWRQRKELLK